MMRLSPKIKYWLAGSLIGLAAFAFVYMDLVKNSGKDAAIDINPETIQSSAGQTTINIDVNTKTTLQVFTASLKSADGIKTDLYKTPDGNFTGFVKIPAEQLNKPRTITFGLYLNGLKTSKTVRIAVTDIPVTLPKDPGVAGKATLAGSDSDHDGVRDDLQREIVFMYPEKDQLRKVLRAMVIKGQDMITTQGDHEHYKSLMISYFALRNCYEYLAFPIGSYDSTNGDILWNIAQNTPERKKTIEDNQDTAKPFTSTSYSNPEACSQPLVKGQF